MFKLGKVEGHIRSHAVLLFDLKKDYKPNVAVSYSSTVDHGDDNVYMLPELFTDNGQAYLLVPMDQVE